MTAAAKKTERHIDGNPHRLLVAIEPIAQDLYLRMPVLEKPGEDTYTGETRVEIDVKEPTNQITLNAKGIEFTEAATISNASLDGGLAISQSTIINELEETVTFVFDKTVVGECTLWIRFGRSFNPPSKMRGLHESVYTLEDGTERVMATTQFESTHAREAFPCFDDPAQKAVFNITLEIPEDRTAISCAGIKEEIINLDGTKTVVFEPTPRMSTYLLAFIVGDFEYIESFTNDGTPVRVYTTPGKIDQGQFALETAVRCTEYFSDYFGFPYRDINGKLDILAIPDFEAGAMENVGAATFREVLLLTDPEQTSTLTKHLVAEVIAHEISHMWFGDLVTPFWWNNLWLKESFATLMSYEAMDALFPEWNVWDDFVANMTSGGKSLAGLRSGHPIEVPVQNPEDIDQIYDAISYNMGGSALRMLKYWLGVDVFRSGIRLYVERHAFENACTEDLWSALEDVSDKPVLDVMNTWTKQTGYPVVHVEETEKGLLLRQERFILDRDPESNEEDPTLWAIPITMTTADGVSTEFILDEREKILEGLSIQDYPLLNSGYAGLYRVNYPKEVLHNLASRISSKEFSVLDRLGIEQDVYNLMRAGYVDVATYLELVSSYASEENNEVWGSITGDLNALSDIFVDDERVGELLQWARDLVSPLAERLGWEPASGEDDNTGLLRQTVLSAASRFGNEAVIENAHNLFGASDVSLANVDPNLRGAVLSTVARDSGNDVFNAFVERHQEAVEREKELGPELNLKFLGGLAFFTSEALINRALGYSLSDNVRPQDAMRVWRLLPVSSRPIAWEYLKRNWKTLDDKFGSTRMIGSFIAGSTAGVTDTAFANEVEQFFLDNPAPHATETIRQTLEDNRACANFLARNEDALEQFFG